MVQSSPSLSRLLIELRKLPGVGEKTALRLALHLLRTPEHLAFLAATLLEVRERVTVCATCFGITEVSPCLLCSAPRDDTTLCVVEEAGDMLAVERTHAFRGRYHVLQGVLSPLQGVTPGDLRIDELMTRLRPGTIGEVVIATNFTVEGEATSLYLARLIKPLGVRVTRLAHGIPTGSDLEYVDAATVQHALERRSEL